MKVNVRLATLKNSNSQIEQLLSSEHLPALIDNLPPSTLHSLIEKVGVERSHEIIAVASNEQIRAVLDIQLWQTQLGSADQLKIGNFNSWLQIWNDLGAEFITNKIQNIACDLFVLSLARYFLIHDLDKISQAGSGIHFGRFQLDFITDWGAGDIRPNGRINPRSLHMVRASGLVYFSILAN